MTKQITTKSDRQVLPTAPVALPAWLQALFTPGEEVVQAYGPEPSLLLKHQAVATGIALALLAMTAVLLVLGGAANILHKQGILQSDEYAPNAFLACVCFFFGGTLLLGKVTEAEKKDIWRVITNRRLFVVHRRKLTEEYDRDVLRRCVAALAPPEAAGPADNGILALTKFNPAGGSTASAQETFANIDRVLAMFKLAEHLRGLSNSTSAASLPAADGRKA